MINHSLFLTSLSLDFSQLFAKTPMIFIALCTVHCNKTRFMTHLTFSHYNLVSMFHYKKQRRLQQQIQILYNEYQYIYIFFFNQSYSLNNVHSYSSHPNCVHKNSRQQLLVEETAYHLIYHSSILK